MGGTPGAMVRCVLSVWGNSRKVSPGLRDRTGPDGCPEKLCTRQREGVEVPVISLPWQIL